MTGQFELDLVATRRSLHIVAEHVLAADRHRNTGRLGLHPAPGGFGTPAYEVHGETRQLQVRADGLVVRHGENVDVHPVRTLAQVADDTGLEVGGPDEVYELVTPCELDAPLPWIPEAVDHLATFLSVVADGLERFARRHEDEDPTEAQLWPEHFDLAISMDEVNYGGCLGDDDLSLPYLYVSPWSPLAGTYWNQPWGAGREWRPGLDVERYFESGWEVVAAGRSSS